MGVAYDIDRNSRNNKQEDPSDDKKTDYYKITNDHLFLADKKLPTQTDNAELMIVMKTKNHNR